MSTTPSTQTPEQDAALRRALSSTSRPQRANPISAALTFGWRGMLKIKHVPEQLIDVTLTPVMFVLMFTYLFGGAIAGSTDEYLQFILPGVLAMAVMFTTIPSGVTLNTDLTKGVVDRFRSLPIWQPTPLVGALLGDTLRYLLAAAITLSLGFALGFDAEGGPGGVLAALGLIVAFAFGLSWIFTTLGLLARTPNAVTSAGYLIIFPLTFLTNVFIDPDTLPSTLKTVVDVNPISHLVSATRDLMAGQPAGEDILVVLAAATALTAIFAPITTHLYRTRT